MEIKLKIKDNSKTLESVEISDGKKLIVCDLQNEPKNELDYILESSVKSFIADYLKYFLEVQIDRLEIELHSLACLDTPISSITATIYRFIKANKIDYETSSYYLLLHKAYNAIKHNTTVTETEFIKEIENKTNKFKTGE